MGSNWFKGEVVRKVGNGGSMTFWRRNLFEWERLLVDNLLELLAGFWWEERENM